MVFSRPFAAFQTRILPASAAARFPAAFGPMFDHVEKLKEYVRCASVSADPQFAPGMKQAREFIAGLLRENGFAVEIVPTAKHPLVLASRGGDPKWPHVLIYGHYDVQPADPLELWQ